MNRHKLSSINQLITLLYNIKRKYISLMLIHIILSKLKYSQFIKY